MTALDFGARGLAVQAKRQGNIRHSTRRITLPQRVRAREVMAVPPTVTYGTTNPIVSPREWSTVQIDAAGSAFHRLSPALDIRKGSNVRIAGTGFPDHLGVNAALWQGAGGYVQSGPVGAAFMHHGSELTFYFKQGSTTRAWVKVNGQYVTLAPYGDATNYFLHLNFGSAALREIEIVGYQLILFSVFTRQTDTVAPLPPRGPRTILQGDSFFDGTGTANNGIDTIGLQVGDLLGWDDVRSDAIGGTGILNPGAAANYLDRLDYNVLPHEPELYVLCGSGNDWGYGPAAVAAQAALVLDRVAGALPDCRQLVVGSWANKGGGDLGVGAYLMNDALRELAAKRAVPFVDLLEGPMPGHVASDPLTLQAAAAAGANTLSVDHAAPVGSSWRFGDGAHVLVRGIGGVGPFNWSIDYLQTAQANGAALTPCGPSLWTGSGRVGLATGVGNCDVVVSNDGTHPSQAGHDMIAMAIAHGAMRVL